MQSDVAIWCHTCSTCATHKSLHKRIVLLFSQQGLATHANYGSKYMGPLPECTSGNSYVLVVSDYFTKWVEVYAIPNQEASTVARKLMDEMFCRFSPPEQLHSDQGRKFESELISEICKLLQTQQKILLYSK